MGLKNLIKNGPWGGFGIKRRVNLEQLREDTSTIKNATFSVLGIGVPQPIVRRETFEESLQRLHLTEVDVKRRMRTSFIIISYSLGFVAAIIAYMIYLYCVAKYFALLPCVILILVLLSFAMREHFYYFQMKKRRLGCTLGDWFKYVFLGR